MTEPQKKMLSKISPENGHFSQSAIETRVLHALCKAGLVKEKGRWKFHLTDAGRTALAEST